jgi:hypothetical protein
MWDLRWVAVWLVWDKQEMCSRFFGGKLLGEIEN